MSQTQTKTMDSVFDKVNAQMSLTVYHREQWISGNRATNCGKYYLKKTNDAAYQDASFDEQTRLEFAAATKTIENKLHGANAKNEITRILLYFNDNKGGTLPAVQNTFICMLNVQSGGRFERKLNLDLTAGNPEAENAINDLLAAWEFHIKRTQK